MRSPSGNWKDSWRRLSLYLSPIITEQMIFFFFFVVYIHTYLRTCRTEKENKVSQIHPIDITALIPSSREKHRNTIPRAAWRIPGTYVVSNVYSTVLVSILDCSVRTE